MPGQREGHSPVSREAQTMPLHSLTPLKVRAGHTAARPARAAQPQSQPAVAEAAREGKQGGAGGKQEG